MASRGIVVTTINTPTRSMSLIADVIEWDALVIGDRKTPVDWHVAGIRYVPPGEQERYEGELGIFARMCPWDHYARKNVGYLIAFENHCDAILETDDDNIPYPSFGTDCSPEVLAKPSAKQGWDNVYRYFTKSRVWPRGFPLECVLDSFAGTPELGVATRFTAPIQQYLADDDPDVDAVYRLVNGENVRFLQETIAILPGTWCPFNSQNTLWYPEAYPLMYLPSYVSFRMTDIWRSYVAQAVLHARGWPLVFHGPTVSQLRNAHSLLMDFEGELPGYLNNNAIMQLLYALPLHGDTDATGIAADMTQCYEAMVESGWIPAAELTLLASWRHAVLSATGKDPTTRPVPDSSRSEGDCE